jgi:hypothetical protein
MQQPFRFVDVSEAVGGATRTIGRVGLADQDARVIDLLTGQMASVAGNDLLRWRDVDAVAEGAPIGFGRRDGGRAVLGVTRTG